jgi:hypothetical protein
VLLRHQQTSTTPLVVCLDDFDNSPSLLPFIDIVMAVQWLVYIPQPRPDDVILLRRQQTSTTPGVVFVDDLDITASFHRHEQFVMAVQRLVYIPSLDLINGRCSTSTVSVGPMLVRHHSTTEPNVFLRKQPRCLKGILVFLRRNEVQVF